MRTFAVIAVVCIAFPPRNAGAGFDVSLELDLADASDATTGAFASKGDRGPFTAWWEERGIEEINNVFGGYTGYSWRPKPRTAIDRKELFAGMWTTPSMLEQPSRCRIPCSNLPSTIPPFVSGSLAADLWPRTRAYVRAHDHDSTSMVFGGIALQR
jgi:hypothetical protein